MVRSDDRGESLVVISGKYIQALPHKQGFINVKCPELNRAAERALGTTQNAALAACIQAPIPFSSVGLPPSRILLAEAIYCACDPLNHTATTSNPGYKSPCEMWHGKAAPAPPHLIPCPDYCRWGHPSKPFPKCGRSVYLGPVSTAPVIHCEC